MKYERMLEVVEEIKQLNDEREQYVQFFNKAVSDKGIGYIQFSFSVGGYLTISKEHFLHSSLIDAVRVLFLKRQKEIDEKIKELENEDLNNHPIARLTPDMKNKMDISDILGSQYRVILETSPYFDEVGICIDYDTEGNPLGWFKLKIRETELLFSGNEVKLVSNLSKL